MRKDLKYFEERISVLNDTKFLQDFVKDIFLDDDDPVNGYYLKELCTNASALFDLVGEMYLEIEALQLDLDKAKGK